MLTACEMSNAPRQSDADNKKADLITYAKHFSVYEDSLGYEMIFRNPWDSMAILKRVFLIPDTIHIDDSLFDAEVLRTPVKSVVSFSSTQWAVFLQLGEIDRVKGILESKYTLNDSIHKLIASGRIADVGMESSYNIEKMLQIAPDLILYSPYYEGNTKALEVIETTLLPFADYLENDPLARMEWMKVVGLLTGREHDTELWFDSVVVKYQELKALCQDVSYRPTVFSDKAFNGQWYLAGGKSYIAQLFADAGANYIWSDNDNHSSFPLDMESILNKAVHADFWRMTNSLSHPLTYKLLGEENPIYPLFDAYKNRKIIICDIMPTAYFEQSQYEPHILLSDFIYHFHPEIMKEYDSTYSPKYYYLLND